MLLLLLQTQWERFSLEDHVRAETQLTADYAETYPVGLAINRTAQQAIPLGKCVCMCVHVHVPLWGCGVSGQSMHAW